MDYRYWIVDVFTSRPFEGNSLAVFPDARGLQAETMQKIAREMNLSETTFVTPATTDAAAARVRIFTPTREMRFAGHPTLGTAFVVREEGVVAGDLSSFVLDENIGPVSVRVEPGENGRLWLQTPNVTQGREYDRALCARALGLAESDLRHDVPCTLLSAGNPNLFIPVHRSADVDRIVIDDAALGELLRDEPEPTCVFAFAAVESGAYSRMFAPALGIAEDPATGSATGPLAKYLMNHGLVETRDGTTFVNEQGVKMGRRSLLHVEIRGDHGCDGIYVGGHVTAVAEATMHLKSPVRLGLS